MEMSEILALGRKINSAIETSSSLKALRKRIGGILPRAIKQKVLSVLAKRGPAIARALRPLAQVPPIRRALRALAPGHGIPSFVCCHLSVVESFHVRLSASTGFDYQGSQADSVGNVLFWRGRRGYEWETTRIFCLLARESRFMADIGANTGVFSLLALAVNPEISVIAFEPHPLVFRRLTANISLNKWFDRCRLEDCALSDQRGSAPLFVPKWGYLPTGSRLAPWGNDRKVASTVRTRVDTLDSAVGEFGLPDLIKIDVEGHEPKVLAGMQGILRQAPPTIILECNPGGPADAIEDILSPCGYKFYHLTNKGPTWCQEIIPDLSQRFRNWLCLPPGKRLPRAK
jgi:FkbM family methyltransferase